MATLRPAANFNANQDAEALKKAMKGMGCDEKTLLNILCKRSAGQRKEIQSAFKVTYGEDLTKELIKELKGHLEDLIVSLMFTPDEYDALELYNALKGIGTKENILSEILAARTNSEISGIKAAYFKLFHKELEKSIASDTSGDFKHLLVTLVQGNRDESVTVNETDAVLKAKQLFEAGVKKLGTDESVFNSVIGSQNYAQLNLIFNEYKKLAKNDIEVSIQQEFSGDVRDALLAVVRVARSKPGYFAGLINKAVKGIGTDDPALMRVIVSRCEKDLQLVKQEYQRQYANSVESAVSGDTAGKYKTALLMLCGTQ